MANSKEITTYLKGIAILGVLVSHYRAHFLNADPALEGYGNALVVVFFIVSGYGNRLSMLRRAADKQGLMAYYRDRVLRIFPLYWLSLLPILFVSDIKFSFTTWIGLNSTPFWFVHAFVLCIIVAPVLEACILKLGAKASFFYILAFIIVINILARYFLPSWKEALLSNPFCYRGVVLGHIFTFFLGMLLPMAEQGVREQADNHGLAAGITKTPGMVWIVTLIAAAIANGVELPEVLNAASGLAFFGLVYLCSLGILVSRSSLPASTFIKTLGVNSYPLFLFEGLWFFILLKMDTRLMTRPGLLAYILAFPIFLYACGCLEKFNTRLAVLTRG